MARSIRSFTEAAGFGVKSIAVPQDQQNQNINNKQIELKQRKLDMKDKHVKMPVLMLAVAGTLALSSCSSTPEGKGEVVAAGQKGVPGGIIVETYQTTAKVTAIDATTRKVTLQMQDGKKTTFKAGPEVVNFPQIQVGDQVKARVTEELAVAMAKPGTQPDNGAAALVALAPVGAKPGGLMAETVQITAKITAINLKGHKATLQFPDGTTHTVAVRKDVDLTQRKVGEEVVIRCTEAIAITVTKSSV